MKEAFIFPGPKVTIKDVDFPTLPSPNHLVIQVIVAGSNPKDWAIAERGSSTLSCPHHKPGPDAKS
jgi:NADPH:quinone reductase